MLHTLIRVYQIVCGLVVAFVIAVAVYAWNEERKIRKP